jgi:ribosome biogenesis GTPase A/tetratricopeptide (TPR) repeat protein
MSLLDRAARFIDDVLLLGDDQRAALEAGEADLAAGRVTRAERRFRRVLEERPSLLRARQGLALSLEAQQRLAEARAIVAFSRQLDPDAPDLALLGARLAWKAGALEAAVREAREASRRLASEGGEAFAEAATVRARAERALGRPDRAARELRKALAATDTAALRAELAEVLAEAGQGRRAEEVAAGLPADAPSDIAERLGRALYDIDRHAAAEKWLARSESRTARLTRAEIALAEGRLEEAEERVRQIVAEPGGAGPDALAVLGEVLIARGDPDGVDALLAASEARGGDAVLLRRAARAVPLDGTVQPARVAGALARLEPAAPEVVALRVFVALEEGRTAEANRLLDDLGPSTLPRVALGRARLALTAGDAQAALDVLATIALADDEEADRARVASLRQRALRALWTGEGGEVDLAAAIDEVARFATAEAELAALGRRALQLRDELDRPLLLAILGEFNAGKSTLVNAIVGADVAPTGFLPTTATLNVLRAGAERRVRVVRQDGRTREGDYGRLNALLEEAEEEGQAIDHVEIVLPSELLERVWILDTPGSNAPVPEHEALAKQAIERADAALWIFDAGQAGKATEGEVLRAVRGSRRRVVAALNKVDRLTDGQLEKVKANLAEELPEVGTEVVALSAKRALRAKLAGDDAALAASGFPELLAKLEGEVFDRSRSLKRQALGGRLIALLDEALAAEASRAGRYEARRALLAETQEPLDRATGALRTEVDGALEALEGELAATFEQATDEVLAFIRPRSNRFARHGVDLEDREFLREVLEGRLSAAVRSAEARLTDRAVGVLAAPAERLGEAPERIAERVQRHLAPALAAFEGYQRGLLDGGGLRRFFEQLVASELDRGTVRTALEGTRAGLRQALRPGLEEGMVRVVNELDEGRRRALKLLGQERAMSQASRVEPLRVLRTVLDELVEREAARP